MRFKDFFEMSSLMDLLSVPQRPDFHAEGPVINHTRLVRGKIDDAIRVFQQAVSDPQSSMSNLTPQITEDERNILRLAAWLHDIGKGPATVVKGEEDIHWSKAKDYNPNNLRSVGHEEGRFFNPVARKLLQSPLWKKIYDNSSAQDKKDLWFIIRNHMSLNMAFSRRILGNMLDEHGKYKNTRRVRLLIIFILMDRLGRVDGGANTGVKDIETTLSSIEAGAKRRFNTKQSQPAPNDEQEFVAHVAPRLSGKSLNQQIPILRNALQGKFLRPFFDDEVRTLLQIYYGS